MANEPTDLATILEPIVDRLAAEFDGTLDRATVARFVETSYDDLAARATTLTFVPLLAERFARQRLDALARTMSKPANALPAVLFLCVQNAGRSQMALGWFNTLAEGRAVAWSGGSEPGAAVNPATVKAMAEVGIDISGEFPKPWTEEIMRAVDVVVTMGCGDTCPYFPGTRYVDWPLDDPEGMGVEAVRPIRDDIRSRVVQLLDDLGIEAT
jgi:protein-tyrosine-phosphatase